MPFYPVISCSDFTPNLGQWTGLGNVVAATRNGNVVALQTSDGLGVQIILHTATMFRVRFNPQNNFTSDNSYAVVDERDDTLQIALNEFDDRIDIATAQMMIVVRRHPYSLEVYRGTQQIHADTPDYNVVHIPGQEVIANFKVLREGSRYYGLGEKAGARLAKNGFSTTQFNYDNFCYLQGPRIPGHGQNPLNPMQPLYCSIPFLLEINPQPQNGAGFATGLFFDNPSQSFFNVAANDYSDMSGKYYFGALFGELDYYFMAGPNAEDVLRQYTDLTGRSGMPPRYAFGYHQGAYGYYKAGLLLEVANNYRAAGIPIDGLHIDVDFQNNYRTFTSSEIKFPKAPQLFDELHGKGFRCSTNITPLINHYPVDESGNFTPYPALESGLALSTAGQPSGAFIFNTRVGEGPNPSRFVGTVDYGSNPGLNPVRAFPLRDDNALRADGFYPDLGRPDVQEWWGQQYQYLINIVGLDMIWQDMTCPALQMNAATPDRTFPLDLMVNAFGSYSPNAKVHNGYVMNLLDATFRGVEKLRPEKRVFIIARGGYAGMQRYAGLWTGDSASSWDFLSINIPEVLNLGLSGVPISGSDIGGFAQGNGPSSGSLGQANLDPVTGRLVGGQTSPELLARWMILGAFLPWFRNHYNGYVKAFQEPYAYPEPVPSVCRYIVGLRYRLFHVFYSAMYEWTARGLPIARPLFMGAPNDMEAFNHADDQFFLGGDILVAPIVSQSETRDVYLPRGSQWYAFMDNSRPLGPPIEGGTLVKDWRASLHGDPQFCVPVYVRAGAVIPTCELQQYMGQIKDNPPTLNIYPGADAEMELYEDDGETNDARDNGKRRRTRIRHEAIANGQRVRIDRVEDGYARNAEFYFVSLLGTDPPISVLHDGRALPNVANPAGLWSSTVNAYYHNASIKQTFLKVFDRAASTTLEVTF